MELYSPDGLHSLILRAGSTAQCQAWVSGLSHTLADSTQLALNRANRFIHEVLEGKARYMGWLLKKTGTGTDGSATNSIKVYIQKNLFSSLQKSIKILKVTYICLTKQSRSQSTSSDGDDSSSSLWHPNFVVITDKELRLYNSPPWSYEAWGNPYESWPLLTTRWASETYR